MKIYLARHGRTMLNELGRAQGWADSPLIEEGVTSAKLLGQGFKARGVHFDAVYTADMVRHFQTATLVLEAMSSPLVPVRLTGLREMCFGGFEGGSNREMMSTIARENGFSSLEAMLDVAGDLSAIPFLGVLERLCRETTTPAERPEDVCARMLDTLTGIATAAEDASLGEVLVVSSGITIQCGLSMVDPGSGYAESMRNASVSEIVFENGIWIVESTNDMSFLNAGIAALQSSESLEETA